MTVNIKSLLKPAFLLVLVSCVISCGIVAGKDKIIEKYSSVEKVKPKIPIKAHPFNLKQVRLLDGPFKEAMERDRKYLHELESDRLLHTFRVNAGLASSARPLGGWERPDCELRGHTMGHYLTACALMYAGTGDEKLKAKADAIVAELARCQKALGGGGYLSAYPEEFIDRLEAGKGVWAPWYTLHKIYAGLLDMYVHCGNKQALEMVKRMTAWAERRTNRLAEEHMKRVLNVEFGGMNEVFANIYAVTGDLRHLALAWRFDHKAIFDPLSRHEDRLRGLHVNTQIPKIIGAAREYELTGEKYYREIARFFWKQVACHRSFAIGGTSNYEAWRTEPDKLAGELSVESAETCCTYNMLKLTRHLFEWEARAEYADYYERALYNQILASQCPQTGMTMYYIAMKPGHWKVFCTPRDSFWCCTGTGMENHAKYGDSIYFYDGKGLFVNLFIASELTWPDKGVVIRQETKFPEEEGTTLILRCKKPLTMDIRIRIPYWATKGVTVRINGEKQQVSTGPGSYVTLSRKWKNGDRVKVDMPMSLHLHRMPDNRNIAAIMYGPLVLAGELGTDKLTRKMQYVSNQRAQHGGPSIDVPQFVVAGEEPTRWIKPVAGKSLTFRTVGVGRPKDVTLIPFYKLFGRRYTIYWNMNTETEYQKRMAELRAHRQKQAARQKMIAERMIDLVEIGNADSERQHNLQLKNSYQDQYAGKNWRDARNGGWFSYDLKVLPGQPMALMCTYWGDDAGRAFRILVNDRMLCKAEIEGGHTHKFFDAYYDITPSLTTGREKVTVKFQSDPQGYAGGVFGLIMLKEK